MESSPEYMDLEQGRYYRFMMMSGNILEGAITDPFGAYNTFHVKIGQASRQFYYWDVDYAYPLEDN